MTSEVIVMNKNGLAMAADSSATVYPDNHTHYKQKKIFPLPYPHCIGLMVYEKLRLNAVPWEALIAMYIQQIGSAPLDHIEDYMDSFLSFLQGNTALFEHEDPKLLWVYDALNYLETLSTDLRQDWQDQNQNVPNTSFLEFFTNHLNEKIAHLEGLPTCHGFSYSASRKKAEHALQEFGLDFLEQFIGLYNPPSNTYKKIFKLLTLLTVKENFEFGYTGIVCAGYGQTNIFPAVVHTQVGGVYFDKIKHSIFDTHKITNTNQAQIMPFAATNTISSFISGIHPTYENFSLREFHNCIEATLLEIFNIENDPETVKKIQAASLQCYDAYKRKLSKYVMTHHILPVIENIKFLPSEGLSNVAKSLINISAFKSDLNNQEINVGGRIETATLTKAEGFNWNAPNHSPQEIFSRTVI